MSMLFPPSYTYHSLRNISLNVYWQGIYIMVFFANVMNEQKLENKKRVLPFPIIVLCFVGIIVFMAWVSIKIVNLAPTAFSSLASLAESLNSRQQQSTLEADGTRKILVTSNVTLANVDETITLSWGEPSVPGTFTFSYTCQDGITINLVDIEGIRNIDCDTNYNIGNITSLELSVSSEKNRYVDVAYTISFLGTNDVTPRATGSAQLTIINTDVKTKNTAAEETPEPPEKVTGAIDEPAIETPPTVTAPEQTQSTYTQEYIYTIPVSNPNGRTDLGTVYRGAGIIVGNTFSEGLIKRNKSGAIQFEVKNYGQKTSGDWTFQVALPDGTTYTSSSQEPLKPNERALLTIGFTATDATQHTFIVTVKESTDHNVLNDRLKEVVTFY